LPRTHRPGGSGKLCNYPPWLEDGLKSPEIGDFRWPWEDRSGPPGIGGNRDLGPVGGRKYPQNRPFSGILRNGVAKKSRPKVPVKHGTRQFIQYLKQLFFFRKKKSVPHFFSNFVQNLKKKPVTAKIFPIFDPFSHLWISPFLAVFWENREMAGGNQRSQIFNNTLQLLLRGSRFNQSQIGFSDDGLASKKSDSQNPFF
jgi:hypothetical protein